MWLFVFGLCNDLPAQKITKYRAAPLDTLSYEQAKSVAVAKGFFDATWNVGGKGSNNQFEVIEADDGKAVIDHASELMWQQAGSSTPLTYQEAHEYVASLNRKKWHGFDDWRLPTLEEAMSLLERKKSKFNLHIDPVFDSTQQWIWTADKNGAEIVWVILFDFGAAYEYMFDVTGFVRAVRSSLQPPIKTK